MDDSAPVALHCEITGEGPPLIVLHGLFGSLANWRPLGRVLGQTHQVFMVDLRNHGRSPHSAIFNYDVLARDVLALMQQHDLPAAHIMGHSLGGKTAMQFALQFRQMVRKLVVVDMSPCATRARHREILTALQNLDLNASSRSELDAQLAQNIPDAAVRQFLLMNIANGENGRFRWRINLDSLADNYDEILRAIDAPRSYMGDTLFIRGENSDYICEDDIKEIGVMFPHSRIVTIEGAGHWVHAQAPQEFARVVGEFLAE